MLVGRPCELEAAAACVKNRVPLLVVGEAGIGKTTLLREVATSSGRRVFEGGGLATLTWASYLALERALGEPLSGGDVAAVATHVTGRVDGGLLIIDDLHWTDLQTQAVLPLLAGRIALLAGLRTGDPGTADAHAVARAAGFESLTLEPLGDAEARVLLRSRYENLPEHSIDRVIERARGNPFLLEELGAGDEPSESLRLALVTRLCRCSPDARTALALLALLERPAEPELFGEAISELLDAGLVLRDGDAYRLRHDLLGEAARSELAADDLRRLHRRLAQTLDDPGESARHLQKAGDFRAAHARALEAAKRTTRPGERARHLGVAAACAAGPSADALRLHAAEALLEAGEHAEAERVLRSVEPGDAHRDAEVMLFRARARWAAGSPEQARELIDSGLALAGGTGLPVEAHLRAAAAEFPLWDWNAPAAVQRAHEALVLARTAGLNEARFRCLYGRALYIAGSAECLEHLVAALEQARRSGVGEAECEAGAALAAAYHVFARPTAARQVTRSMVDRARALQLRGWELNFRFSNAFLGMAHQGAYDDAIAELTLLLQQPGLGPQRDEVAAYLALALADVGRDREATALLSRSSESTQSGWGRALLLYVRAEIEWLGGRSTGAVASADACLRTESPPLLAWAAATRAWAVADTGGCSQAVAPTMRVPLNAPIEPLIKALNCFNDRDRALEAERLFLEAAELCAGLVYRTEVRCLWAAGEAARRGGAIRRARRRLLQVEQTATAHGLVPLLARIQKSLRLAGVRRTAPRKTAACGLTAREREVLALVGSGCTSADIARRLGLTVGTVDSEVRSAMTKLNASTRVQAALLSVGEPAEQTNGKLPPLIVVEAGPSARAEAVAELRRRGWQVHEGLATGRPQATDPSRRRFLASGVISDAEDTASALVLAAYGAGLVIELDADSTVTDPFLEDLRHLGQVEHRCGRRAEGAALDHEQDRLLTLLAEGRSIAEAATLLHISQRTAERRLAAARATLGVRTTAEAVLTRAR